MKPITNRTVLSGDNASSIVIEDCGNMLHEAGFRDDMIRQFTDDTIGILNDYAELVGVGTEVRYILQKKFTKIELNIFIPGASYDPFENGREARERSFSNIFSLNLNTETVGLSHTYVLGYNVVSVSLPLSEKRKKLYKSPMFLAVVLGIVLGLLCRY